MEVVLNILWVLVTFGAFTFLLPKARGRKAAVIGLACVAALLFPIISVSDDLSANDAWEEATTIRRATPLPPASTAPHVAIIADAIHVAVALLAIGIIETRIAPALTRLLPAETEPRSPPALSR